jgi:hypothetical protein
VTKRFDWTTWQWQQQQQQRQREDAREANRLNKERQQRYAAAGRKVAANRRKRGW